MSDEPFDVIAAVCDVEPLILKMRRDPSYSGHQEAARERLRDLSLAVRSLVGEMAKLADELDDARAEIARHHADFEQWEAGWVRSAQRADLLREALYGPVPDDWEQRAIEAVR